MITDAAININPDVGDADRHRRKCPARTRLPGHRLPQGGRPSAVENVTEKMVSTVTAAEIAKRGVPGCIISGPLALTALFPWNP